MRSVTRLYIRILLHILGVFGAIILLEALLQVWSILQARSLNHTKILKKDMVILAIGESTTTAEYSDSWPEQLQGLLKKNYPKRDIQVVNKGRAGDITTILIGSLEQQILEYKPDIIISMMGINDQYTTEPYLNRALPQPGHTSIKTMKLLSYIWKRSIEFIRITLDLSYFSNKDTILKNGIELYNVGRYAQAEHYFKRIIILDPRDTLGYVWLSKIYRNEERYWEAQQLLHSAASKNPQDIEVLLELGLLYRDTNRSKIAVSYVEKALAIDPQNGRLNYELAYLLYHDQLDIPKAKQLFKNAIASHYEEVWSLIYLSDIAKLEGKNIEAKTYIEYVLKDNPTNVIAQKRLIAITTGTETGQVAGLDTNPRPLGSLVKYENYTIENFEQLFRIASKYQIPVIVMQYPLQPVSILKTVVENHDLDHTVVSVVDNEENFKRELRSRPYDNLFHDNFGGNFGHATKLGNSIIAENVLNSVRKIIEL